MVVVGYTSARQYWLSTLCLDLYYILFLQFALLVVPYLLRCVQLYYKYYVFNEPEMTNLNRRPSSSFRMTHTAAYSESEHSSLIREEQLSASSSSSEKKGILRSIVLSRKWTKDNFLFKFCVIFVLIVFVILLIFNFALWDYLDRRGAAVCVTVLFSDWNGATIFHSLTGDLQVCVSVNGRQNPSTRFRRNMGLVLRQL